MRRSRTLEICSCENMVVRKPGIELKRISVTSEMAISEIYEVDTYYCSMASQSK